LVGSVRHEFTVPAPDTFRISTPVLTDTTQPTTSGAPGRPVPIARRTFRAGARIFSAFDVYGARAGARGPQATLQYSLRGPDGAQVVGGGPQALRPNAAGQFSAAVGLTLPATAAGEHELVLTVRDEVSGTTIEDRESLLIER
jgi:hypothetical protein